jgi:small nuclear ribonucleoprotein (snRNP)-like protein
VFGARIVEPEAWLARVLKKKIVVHLKNDQSIEGVLMEQTQDGVILRAAALLGNDGKRTPMAGETFVPRENVAFAQLDE